jgi:hypothetical protein
MADEVPQEVAAFLSKMSAAKIEAPPLPASPVPAGTCWPVALHQEISAKVMAILDTLEKFPLCEG